YSLVDDLPGDRRVLLEECAQSLVDELGDCSSDIGIQLALGLAFELRLRKLHADDRHQAFANIISRQVLFDVLKQAQLLPGVIDGAGQGRRESTKMRPAVDGVDVMGEAERRCRVRI